MKITKEHYNIIESAIKDYVKLSGRTFKETKELYSDYTQERFRWDLLWASKVTTLINLWDYYNDSHIDTALKNIVENLNSLQ